MEDPRSETEDDPDSSASFQAAMGLVTASLGPMEPLIRQLHSLTTPPGVSDGEIQSLKKNLEELCIGLKDVSEAENPSLTAKCWMKQVRELLYDANDYFDVEKHCSASKDARDEFEIIEAPAREFKILEARAKHASERRKRYEIDQPVRRVKLFRYLKEIFRHWLIFIRNLITSFVFWVDLIDHGHMLPELDNLLGPVHTDLIDHGHMLPQLANLLGPDGEKQTKVVSIVGPEGVGKTTIAKRLYHELGWQFNCRAFVRVSPKPDMRRLLASIFIQIQRKQPTGSWDTQLLIEEIAKHLQNKRYFIIIDDLWTTPVWDIISRAFPDSDCHSRIITTTQIEDVALACCSYQSKYIFKMSPLNDDQSQKLFFNRVFGSKGEDGCPKDFKEVSYGIIRKCGGLPLATIYIAGLLLRREMGQWENVRRSLSSTFRTNGNPEGMEVVNLIYNDLPRHLKTCLLYLIMYPEDYTIGKNDLVKQWVAEGFIKAVKGEETEKIAEGYFDELVSRGIIQPVDTNYKSEVLSCTVHHLVLDLIRYKSMEENFITTVDNFESTIVLHEKVRRLSVQFGGEKSGNIPTGFMMSQVRSLLFCGFFKCVRSIENYRLLQVLALHVWADQDKASFDLTRICKLFRLRYLKVECNITVDLPDKIQELQHLGTLQIDAKLSAVPSDIGHLEKLLHLCLPSQANLPAGIGHMTSLRSLGYFNLSNNSRDNVLGLGKLINLWHLRLTCSTVESTVESNSLVGNIKHLGSILGELSKLKSLILDAGASSLSISCDGLSSVSPAPAHLQRLELPRRCCIFSSLPKWIGELRRLCILKIAVRGLSREDIDILKGLPALTALSLYIQTAPADTIIIDEEGFPVLTYFKFVCAAPCLSFVQGAMPNVLKLKLAFNANRTKPYSLATFCFRHLTGLTEISLKFGSAGADESDRKAAESALEAAVSNHPNTLIIRVQCVDVIYDGEEDKSTATEEKDLEKRHEIQQHKKMSTEHSEEHVNKQLDSRISTKPEPSSNLQNPGGTRERRSMDVLRIVQGVLGSVQALINLLRLHQTVSVELKNGLHFIKKELPLIKWDIQKCEDLQLQLQLQELAYDIDDFIHGLWIPGPYTGYILLAVAMNPGPQDILRIKSFGETIKSLKERLGKSSDQPRQIEGSTATPSPSSSAGSPPRYAPEKDLVGITGPKDEIVELLSPGDGRLRAISIVGCSGLGKTALARALYEACVVPGEFDCKAWVVASECSPADILEKILQQVDLAAASGGSTSEASLHFPKNKRYLVFIDDIQQKEVWDNIKDAFPINNRGSRIIVTTRVHSIADACSYGSYVYKMQCLDEAKSKELFWRKARRCETAPPVPALALAPSPALANGSKSILVKCDGLPLALISAGNYLQLNGRNLKTVDCEGVGKELGNYLVGDESAFGEMKRALVQCYDNLPDYDHMNCLLYLSIFPRGHQINSKSLVRKLIAEELVAGDVRKCLDKLIDQSMIEEVMVGKYSKVVERCKVHSIMLEFIIQKSLSRNFISLIQKQEGQAQHNKGSKVRRLTVQKAGSSLVLPTEIAESRVSDTVRSLTILKSDPHEETRVDAVDFKSYKLLRVLDLEGCSGLNTVIDDICELVFLKYLSLRNTDVDKLPGKVKELKFLETLDIRGTKVKRLPMEVIMLPQLAYLLGKFELTDVPKDTKRLEEFLSEKSQLHTLAGIVTDETQGFEIVIRHARMLKKVKVWCNDTPDDNTSSTAAPADNPRGKDPLRRRFSRLAIGRRPSGSPDPSTSTPDPAPAPAPATPTPLGFPDPNTSSTSSLAGILVSSLTLESLSIDSNGLCKEFLGSLQLTSCIISSIKLRGKLERLPTPATLKDYSNLNRLHLFSTGLSIQDLSALENLECLEYLKLADDRDGSWDGIFHVQVDGFQSLIWLCFEASKHPRVRIEQGAMTRLASLQLLCQESPPQPDEATAEIERHLGVEGISHLAQLNEVILHHSAPDATMEAWKEAAKRHINRPYVKKHPNPNSDTS